MIKISKQTDYALQFLIELSKLKNDELLSLRVFSTKSNISFLFLQKIAKSMREAGLIKATKGIKGGYSLDKNINKISLKDVIEATEGPYGTVACTKSNGVCKKSTRCSVKKGIGKINNEITKYLEKVTIATLSNNN